MITRTTTDWQAQLREAVSDPAELLCMLGLDPQLLDGARTAAKLFSLRAPRSFVSRMRHSDSHDPLLRQVLPIGAEADAVAGFSNDPVGDMASITRPGLLHKYHGRVLLVTTGACAVNCRYCFRRHFPYADENPRGKRWQQALEYIRRDATITEVIFSGGDPLSLTDNRLSQMAADIAAIPHVRRFRLHTRLPIVLPARIDHAFLDWFAPLPLQKIVVIHANHANEIDAEVVAALAALKEAGATVFNQSVLLRGVNDSVPALAHLSDVLFTAGVIPYYLHLLDKVTGAAHFDVPDERALALHNELRSKLPGYLVPKLVREEAGKPGKTPASQVESRITE